MTKGKLKRKPTSRANDSQTKRQAIHLKRVKPLAAHQHAPATQPTVRRESKKVRIIAMLRAPAGATIEAMARSAKWQPHSVRGFLAGVVRKKLGLTLVSADGENGRVYRITDRTVSGAA